MRPNKFVVGSAWVLWGLLILACYHTVFGGNRRYVGPSGTDSDTWPNGYYEHTPWATVGFALQTSAIFLCGDTLQVNAGTWSGGAEPWGNDIVRAYDCGEWTVVLPDTGATPIFDASGQTTQNYGLHFKNVVADIDHIEIRGPMIFRDYPDFSTYNSDPSPPAGTSANNNASSGTLRFSDQAGASRTMTGVRVIGITFEASARDSIDGGVLFFTNDTTAAGGYDDTIDSVFVAQCRMSNVGNAGITVYHTPHLHLVGNQVHRNADWLHCSGSTCSTVDSPNGLQMNRYQTEAPLIEDNHFSGWDHGLELRGVDGILRRNLVHDLSDDFIWLHAGDARSYQITRGWHVYGNEFYHGDDEGLEIQGTGHVLEHNTIERSGDYLVSFTDGGTNGAAPATDITVRWNIFRDSEDGPDSGAGEKGIFLETGHTGNLVYQNVFFDPDGALVVLDQDDGAVTTIADVNAEAYGAGNLEQDPLLLDVTPAPSRPFYDGVILTPAPTSPAVGFTDHHRTAGGLPCSPCARFNLTGVSSADSVHALLLDPAGRRLFFRDDGTWPGARGGERLLDWHIETVAGDWTLEWAVITDGDSILYRDEKTSAALTAAATGDTLFPSPRFVDYSADWRWRRFDRADTLALEMGSGDLLGEFLVQDATASAPIPGARVRVWLDSQRTQLVGNMVMAVNGRHSFAYDASEVSYFWTAWASSYQIEDGSSKPIGDGWEFIANLDAISWPVTADPQLCTITVETIDFVGAPVDSMVLDATFEGEGAESGDLVYSYRMVTSTPTTGGGQTSLDLVRSDEITAPVNRRTFSFALRDVSRLRAAAETSYDTQTWARITVPDEASASFTDMVP